MKKYCVFFIAIFCFIFTKAQYDTIIENSNTMIQSGKFAEAITFLTSKINQSDSLPIRTTAQFFNYRGYAYLQINELDSALADFQHSLKLYQVNPLVYKNLAIYYFTLNDSIEGCAMMKYALYYDYKKKYRTEFEDILKQKCE